MGFSGQGYSIPAQPQVVYVNCERFKYRFICLGRVALTRNMDRWMDSPYNKYGQMDGQGDSYIHPRTLFAGVY